MNPRRDPDAILFAWLDEGPARLPDATRRAIAVSIRTTARSRLPTWLAWNAPTADGLSRYALWAVAVMAVVVGGLSLLRPGPDRSGGVGGPAASVPSATPSPLASPTPSPPARPEPSIGGLMQGFTSPTFGYSIRYPAGWTTTPTTGEGPIPGGADEFASAAGGWHLRTLSRPVPDGVVVDDWIVATLQRSGDPGCMPQRSTQESVTIDGHDGRLMGFCGVAPDPQIEATVVVDDRAYLFTLFDSQDPADEEEARALFDKFLATVTLDPQSATASPSPTPTPSPSPA
jgi:hypothetical protein